MAFERKQIEDYGETEFTKWVDSAESAWGDIDQEYKEARKYYEDVQTPSNAPAGKEYVQENLITDLVNGLVGQLIGGEVGVVVNGGGKYNIPIKELVGDIMDRNLFVERHLEPISNHFYTEGLGGIYTLFNPYKVSTYGIGVPVVHHLLTSEQELLLDPNSRGFMHEDDIYRIFKQARLIEYAEKKYPKLAGEIQPSHRQKSAIRKDTEKFCDIYIIEYMTTDILQISELEDESLKNRLRERYDETTKIEIDRFWQVDMINRTMMGAPAVATGFNRFRLQPVIHTPRIQDKAYPMGISKLMKGKQDQINTVGSVALEAVKADIKNLLVLVNVAPDQQKILTREAAKTNGVAALSGENVQFFQADRKGISPAVLQWYEWQRRGFDEVSGRYTPDKEMSGGLSGKAIGLLHARGTIPELTKKFHLDYAFTEMANVILECVGIKMTKQPFSITRNIDGQDIEMQFNTKYEQGSKLNEEYNSVSDKNIVNDLSQVDIDEIDLSVDVVMDVLGRDVQEANKALLAGDRRLIARKDQLKKLYKDEWRDLLTGIEEEDMAMKILGQLARMGPEALQKLAQQAGNVEEFMNMMDNVEGGNGKKPLKTQQSQNVAQPEHTP